MSVAQQLAVYGDDLGILGYNYLKVKKRIEESKKKKVKLGKLPTVAGVGKGFKALEKVADLNNNIKAIEEPLKQAEAWYSLSRYFRRGMRYGKVVAPVVNDTESKTLRDAVQEIKQSSPEDGKKSRTSDY